jgi:hypothetical protein
MFKFVLTRCGEFYIISTEKYHQDSHVPGSIVWAAGYFDVDGEGAFLEVQMHGKSIGYECGFSQVHQKRVNEAFKELGITFEDFEKKWANQDRGVIVYTLWNGDSE